MDSHLYDNLLILAFAGHARSGKDTAVSFILDLKDNETARSLYNLSDKDYIKVLRFADPIKESVAAAMKDMIGTNSVSAARTIIERYKDKNIKYNNVDIRQAMQQTGTFYRYQDKDFFVNSMIKKIESTLNWFTDGHKIIILIPDTRFENEVELMRETFKDSYKLIKIDNPKINEQVKKGLPPYDHESEKHIDNLDADLVIKNDSDLETLKARVLKAFYIYNA